MTKPLVFEQAVSLAALTFSAAVAGEIARRPARLFVAGEYPDYGLSVTPEDLDRIIHNFNAAKKAVPIKSEHTDSPLDPLGNVVALHREGDELFGMLVFSAGIDAHLRDRHVEHLSVALERVPDDQGGGLMLRETSLVFKPRVQGAGFLTPGQIDAQVARFAASGQLTPAMEPAVRRLLSAPHVFAFSDGSKSLDVAEETLALLHALPVVQPRGGTVVSSSHTFTRKPAGPNADAVAMAQRLGIDPEKLHAHLSKGAAA